MTSQYNEVGAIHAALVVVVDQVAVVGLELVGVLHRTNPAFDSHAVRQFVGPR